MKDSSQNALAERAQRAVEELHSLRQSLLAISEPSAPDATGLTLDMNLAIELKNAVDALRVLLYALSSRPGFQRLAPDFISDFDRLVNGAFVISSRHPAGGPTGKESGGGRGGVALSDTVSSENLGM
jgi:hypothetical protein